MYACKQMCMSGSEFVSVSRVMTLFSPVGKLIVRRLFFSAAREIDISFTNIPRIVSQGSHSVTHIHTHTELALVARQGNTHTASPLHFLNLNKPNETQHLLIRQMSSTVPMWVLNAALKPPLWFLLRESGSHEHCVMALEHHYQSVINKPWDAGAGCN